MSALHPSSKQHPHVIVGLSGGVDSAVTALLLKQQGYRVTGLFMKNWEDDDNSEYCSTRQDLIDAASVCDVLDIELEVVNFSEEYKNRVFSNFLQEYQAGRTPNPDILCNSEIKFRAFLDHALRLGADKIATGHYARIRETAGSSGPVFELLKAKDASKDQSYFLYRLNQAQLSKALFPLGEMLKTKVREIAAQAGLHVASKKDSTGICFIGERPFREFLMRYLPTQPGEIRSLDDGRVIGRHDGLMYHTIGQRKGLHIGGIKGHANADGEHFAWYAAKKNIKNNILYAVQGHAHPALLTRQLKAIDLSWTKGSAPSTQEAYTAKPRYRTPDMPCTVSAFSEDTMSVEFEEAQWALTPGQSLVLYQGDVCLGGGIIAETPPGHAT